jgi:hypothetical protein
MEHYGMEAKMHELKGPDHLKQLFDELHVL